MVLLGFTRIISVVIKEDEIKIEVTEFMDRVIRNIYLYQPNLK